MRLPVVLFVGSAVGLLSLSGTALAQSRSSLGQSGGAGGFTGGSMFSSGASAGRGGASGGLGGGGLGSGGLGGSGGGLGGAGGGLGGGGGQGGGLGGQNGANTIGQQQNAGFIGRNSSNNNQFIGAAAQGLNGQNGNQNGQSNRPSRQSTNQNQFQNTGGQETNRAAGVRPRQKVAFDYPQLQIAQVLTSIEGRFKKLAKYNPSLNSVTLAQAADGTVVLTGEARNAAEAKMAESLVRLEPGVRNVRNEMSFPPPVDDAQ